MKVRVNYEKYANRMNKSLKTDNETTLMIHYIKEKEDNEGLIETNEYMENTNGSRIYNIVGFAMFEDELEIIEE